MREIKFRAWDKSSNIMRTDITSIRYNLDGSINQIDVFEGVDILFPEKEAILMQYTGLKDKNGVEIYEGDIIKAKHDDGLYDIGEVVYGSKGAFCLHLPKVATGIKTPLLNYIHGMMFAEHDFKVIGNIYENPELLKKKLL